MGRKNRKHRAKNAKSAKRRKATILPPAGGNEASTLQALASATVPRDMTPTVPPPAPEAPDAPEIEHRAAPRTSLVVELHMASESHFFSGLSGDISEGGVFVSTYRDLATGTPVDLEFSLPGSDRVVHAKGEVRWHRSASNDVPPGVGIAFEELADEDRALIHRFCTLRPPLYYDDVG